MNAPLRLDTAPVLASTALELPRVVELSVPSRLTLVEATIGVLVALQFTPGLLGHCFMPGQLALALAGIAYMSLRSGDGLRAISLQPVRWLCLVALYFFTAVLIIEPESLSVAFIDLVVAGTGLAYIGTLITNARPRDLLVGFVLIHAVLGVSDLFLLAARVAGVDHLLRLAVFPLKTYAYSLAWHFPFGFTYDQPTYVGGLLMTRSVGIYREPGVYQAFAISACAGALLLRDLPWRRTIAAVILLASACTLSTAWMASVVAVATWFLVSRIDLRSAASLAGAAALAVALVGLLVAAAMIPGLGFSDKLADESGQDRLRAFAAVGPALASSPWLGLGQGTVLSRESIESVSGSFIVAIARLGIVGTLTFLVAAFATIASRYDRRGLVLLVPLGVTMLVSQPLYYSVAAYFLLALPCREALAPALRRILVPAPVPTPAAVPEEELEPTEEAEPDDAIIEEEEDEDDLPLVMIDDELDEECEDENIIPLVMIDDELDDECEDESIIPLVVVDEEAEPTEAELVGAGR